MPNNRKVRELTTDKIGQLVAISGTVTRTSEVRPELFLGVFTCRECGQASVPIVQQFKYTEPAKCSNRTCDNSSSWALDMDKVGREVKRSVCMVLCVCGAVRGAVRGAVL